MIGPSSNHQVRGSEYSNFDMPKKVKLNLNSSNFTSGQMVTKMIWMSYVSYNNNKFLFNYLRLTLKCV